MAGRYDAVLLDLDGVVYRGDQAVPGAAEALDGIRTLGVPRLFLTNNSARTPDQVAAKLASLGIRVEPAEILTSAVATAAMLRRDGAAGLSAFVIGEEGIRSALGEVGVEVRDGEPDRTDLVVVGWDRTVDYPKLRRAALLVQRGARLVATNADASYPAPDGLWPGAGSILAAVTTTTGARPTVVGKPHRPLFEAAVEATGATRPLVVGDRLDTDVDGAAGMGFDALLVLSGASRPPELLEAEALPTYVGRDVSAVLDVVPPARFRVATPAAVEGIGSLLASSNLPTEGLAARLGDTVATGDVDHPDGTACLTEMGGHGLLRSVAVREEVRRSGLGMLAVAAAVARGRTAGVRDVWLFTETAGPFFEQLGFRSVGRSELPEAVASSDQATHECAETAVAMVRELRARPLS
jgi:HAD superfamily hydrolase (TIGR01457 family)